MKLRFLLRLVAEGTPKDALLSSVRALARSVGAEARNPKWTSYGALEIDVFCPSRDDLGVLVAVIGPLAKVEFSRDLNVAPPHRTEVELFREARDCFNAERYWESHEVLEGMWRQKQGPEKRFLQGVILVCAAFVHHQKGEEKVGLSILGRAIAQLDFPRESYGGIDVAGLKTNVAKMQENRRFFEFRI